MLSTSHRLPRALAARAENGWTPLDTAAASGYHFATHLLLEHKADPRALSNAGRTPLMENIMGGFPNKRVIAHFADKGITPEEASACIDALFRRSDISKTPDVTGGIAKLVEKGFKLPPLDVQQQLRLMLACTCSRECFEKANMHKLVDPSVLTMKDEQGNTFLHKLAKTNSDLFIKVVEETGVDGNVKDRRGRSPAQLMRQAVYKQNQWPFRVYIEELKRAMRAGIEFSRDWLDRDAEREALNQFRLDQTAEVVAALDEVPLTAFPISGVPPPLQSLIREYIDRPLVPVAAGQPQAAAVVAGPVRVVGKKRKHYKKKKH